MGERDYADTGFGPIDVEHRALSGALASLVDAVRTGGAGEVRAALALVQRGVAEHFAHEAALMAEHGYPKAKPHQEAHAIFLADAV
ncbi:MAG: hypothetical protein IPO09_18800, partial [Anaeromyxobacter sp.]|nr:hypothetical protein [Anaeromyxobacter sp.]